jgi:hypothetical protein
MLQHKVVLQSSTQKIRRSRNCHYFGYGVSGCRNG